MKPYFEQGSIRIYNGDCREVLRALPEKSINSCVTSPPYWNLRDYGVAGQIGLEKSPADYVSEMVAVFREVWRVLKDDGTLWLNIGDSYSGGGGYSPEAPSNQGNQYVTNGGKSRDYRGRALAIGLKPKDLVGIPWMLAFALRADGWYLRSDIIWHKPSPMPESVTDRPTKSHEYLFLLSKSERYYYDAEAIKEDGSGVSGGASFGKVNLDGPGARRISAEDNARIRGTDKQRGHGRRHAGFNDRWDAMERAEQISGKVNKRDVWTVCPANFPEAHFAVFPPKLIEPCILAGCPDGGLVLDPFCGAGTTPFVCQQQAVGCVGIELNPNYCEIISRRLAQANLFGGAA
jgi:DNA modification methylase